MTDPHRPLLGVPGELCRACGAPLAEDQRYCVACGERRGHPRLPFEEVMATPAPAPAPVAGAIVPPVVSGRWEAAMTRLPAGATTLAGVACLILAMGVGVLIGSAGSGSDAAASAPAPQVISVGAPAAAPAAATSPATTTATGDAAAAAAEDGAAPSVAKKKAASAPAKTKATSSAVKALENSSSGDYQKKSEKLPKELGTGGEAPAKDDKPAAGGGDFVDLG